MTTQELLASLSQLEQELQSIKSARALVEDTVGAYSEVKNDIKKLLSKFDSVTKSLISISEAFKTQNETLSNEIHNSINVVNGQLDTLNSAFANQCSVVIMRFMESVEKASNDLVSKTEALTTRYDKNNTDFKSGIKELVTVHSSLIRATESVTSLKEDIASFQKELNQSQKDQDDTLEKIASQLQATGNAHTQVLTQIAKDLKSSQDAQDDDLDELKRAQKRQETQLTKVAEKQQVVEGKINSHSQSLRNLKTNMEQGFQATISHVQEIISTQNTTKTLLYVNIAISVVACILALVK